MSKKIDRRTALAWLGIVGAATAARSAGIVVRGPPAGGKGSEGYGTDPNLLHPEIPWSRILTQTQLQTSAHLADFILPATADSPAASALGVPDFIDEWVSAPYPDQVTDRPIIQGGLDGLNAQARQRHGASFAKVNAAQRAVMFGELAANSGVFFKRFRALTIGAYYTTEAGFKDIGYIGNVARAFDPGPSAEVNAVLERELKKLGI